MSVKLIGWLAAGVGLAAVVGGLVWYLKRRSAPKKKPQRVTPSKPPRAPEDASSAEHRPAFDYLERDKLSGDLVAELDAMFEDGWPPTPETIDQLEYEDVVVFAVQSEPVGPYEKSIEELISAKVLSVGPTVVRARVIAPVMHSEHLGTTAGHGVRVGQAVDVPRKHILVAARQVMPPDKAEGYDSKGESIATFKPSNETGKTYVVNPGTPYDLRLPYRTEHTKWYADNELVTLVNVGELGLLEQVMFNEDSLRGAVKVRAIDEDPEVGKVLIARWDFKLVD